MAKSFTITTTATDALKTDAKGHAETIFTVTNNTTGPVRGMARVKALPNTKPEWVQIAGDSERDFGPGGTQQFAVSFDAPPPTAAVGAAAPTSVEQYGFRLDVASAMNPDEDFTEGPVVKVLLPPPTTQIKKPFNKKLLLIPIAAVVLIGVGLGLYFARRNTNVVVPNVVGMTLDEASTALAGANLTPVEKEAQITGKAPAGQIIGQEPAAETQVAKGSEVLLIKEGEEPQVDVPDVTKRLVSDAKTRLTEAGLSVVEKSTEVTPGLEINQVVSQNPAGGQKVKPGSTVELTVAVQRQITVPDVTFKPANLAQQQITAAGLKFVMKDPELAPSNVAAGNIKRQNPEGDAKVPPDAVIELVAAAPSTQVPRVIGKKIGEAQVLFQQAGLELGRVSGTVDTGNANTVMITSQTPVQDTTVARGSKVDVAVPLVCLRFQRCVAVTMTPDQLFRVDPTLRFKRFGK